MARLAVLLPVPVCSSAKASAAMSPCSWTPISGIETDLRATHLDLRRQVALFCQLAPQVLRKSSLRARRGYERPAGRPGRPKVPCRAQGCRAAAVYWGQAPIVAAVVLWLPCGQRCSPTQPSLRRSGSRKATASTVDSQAGCSASCCSLLMPSSFARERVARIGVAILQQGAQCTVVGPWIPLLPLTNGQS